MAHRNRWFMLIGLLKMVSLLTSSWLRPSKRQGAAPKSRLGRLGRLAVAGSRCHVGWIVYKKLTQVTLNGDIEKLLIFFANKTKLGRWDFHPNQPQLAIFRCHDCGKPSPETESGSIRAASTPQIIDMLPTKMWFWFGNIGTDYGLVLAEKIHVVLTYLTCSNQPRSTSHHKMMLQ